jgi:hypothetical protein
MLPTEVDQYMNDLLAKGAYRLDGFDPDTGEAMLAVVPEVMKVVDPELFEIYQMQASLELEQSLFHLEELGLITRVGDEDDFTLTEAAQQALSE